MPDKRSVLKSKFDEKNRLKNFGNVIERIYIQGFRCHSSTIIDIKNPITAMCGLNGTGKSTILHLAAAAYKIPGNRKNFSISDFIEKRRFDPAPFSEDARVEFLFHQPSTPDNVKIKKTNIKKLTLSRGENKWNGYDGRLARPVLFVSLGSYLPKIEKPDYISKNIHAVDLVQDSPMETEAKNWICKILSRNYDSIICQEVSLGKKKGKINRVNHSNVNYSEFHMGFGEARSHYLVTLLESLPEKSLVLIEEPEISLHPSAQHHFGNYLVDLCIRKGHQVLLTTHSESLLSALPSESRIFLKRTNGGVEVITGLTASQAHSLMTDGHQKALKIFVEDEGETSTAKIILEEIIRKQDPTLLDYTEIHPIGSCQTVRNVVKILKDSGMALAGVLDADQSPSPRENIFSLPGNNTVVTDRAPEKEIFGCQKVKEYIYREYHLDFETFQVSLAEIDHHEWFEKLAARLSIREVALMTELAKVYISTLPESLRSSLVDQLKAACQ